MILNLKRATVAAASHQAKAFPSGSFAVSSLTKLGQQDRIRSQKSESRLAGDVAGIGVTLSKLSSFLSNYKKIVANFPSLEFKKLGFEQYSTRGNMIVYSRIAPNECPAIAKHLLEAFYVNEPFGGALGLTVAEVESWYPSFLDKVLNYYEPVSFVAKDSETNEICGAAVNIIMDLQNRTPPPSMKDFISKEKNPVKWQICTFLEDLEEGVDPIKELGLSTSGSQKMFVCLFLSVSPGHSGKGIATTLLRESEREAKDLDGVTIAMTDVTSHFSYLAVKKLGYECIKEVQYMTYKDHDGIPIFEGRDKLLGVHTHARVMAKTL